MGVGREMLNGENFLIQGIFKEIDSGFYEGAYGISACFAIHNLNKKNDLIFSKDSMAKLFKENKFMIVNIEEEKLNKEGVKRFNILVRRRVHRDNSLKLIWKRNMELKCTSCNSKRTCL